MKRFLWLKWIMLLILIALVPAYSVLWLTAPTPGITKDNVAALRAGMTVQEVEALLDRQGTPIIGGRLRLDGSKSYLWSQGPKEFCVVGVFDGNGLLTSALLAGPNDGLITINVESWREKLRRWLRL
ncbi:MAG: hypothetical protein HY040_01140 [Planctomycetes bacterium]|nr:hypothetical protein [Planctomycetota bacterium]